ncbi:hypothetical protein ACFOGI_11160 [Virgibacillus xinjiangensis]|uniref:Uncharacterized protein n=1 Tax=Virgibacillus xinjiangensis TaxID=393090 RepID=A0ABV7CWF5_9BACI
MIKEKVIEFLFNNKKYRVEKFVLLILFWPVVLYLSTAFRISLTDLFLPVLTLIVLLSIIQIAWYNKKKEIKTGVSDWIGMIFCLIVLIAMLFINYNENKLENAVYDAIEEKVGNETFTIEFIDEMKKKESYIVVGYTMEDDDTKYLERYYWCDGELVHDGTKEIEDEKN